ncbi:alkaline phosphatase family protein [Silvibacterium acidisoli]|uniref:alkaline phosphatase family protein n=1 Tax=Acidobacteriaceae bacterium ZG23-2 TaxID=2883246 RepID=UPI00406C00D8
MKAKLFAFFLAATLGMVPAYAERHKVVVVSIDGLRGVVLAGLPDPHRNLPNLNEIVSKGAVSEGLIGVLPTVTYPSHTSMVTGVSPSVHGILGNYVFDPEHTLPAEEGWYEYSQLIQAPTLWTVAHQNGLRTASVYWPVTQGASVDLNFPEAHHPVRTEHDRLFYQALCTPGLLAEYEKASGKLPLGTAFNDSIRTQMASFLIEQKKPDLLLIHLVDLDAAEHEFGPDSPQAAATLEKIDGYVGVLRKSITTADGDSDTDLVIVSDHGFFPVEHALHPGAVLASMGLLGTKDHPEKWRVAAFGGGGSFGLVAHDPKDKEAIDLATETFQRMLQENVWGIDRIMTAEQLKVAKGYPNSFLAINMKSGFSVEGGDTGPWLTAPSEIGMHGYAPGPRNLDASFAVTGPGIEHRRLPRAHVVDIAPVVAGLLGITMSDVEGVNILSAHPSAAAH